MENIVLGLVVVFLVIKFTLYPLISSFILIVSFNQKKLKLGKKIEDIKASQCTKPIGNFFVVFSILIGLAGIILSFLDSWLFSLLIIPISLNFLLWKIQNNKCHDKLGLYDGGIIMDSGIVLWHDIHSYFLKDDMVCFYLKNGVLCEYKRNDMLVHKFKEEQVMLNSSVK